MSQYNSTESSRIKLDSAVQCQPLVSTHPFCADTTSQTSFRDNVIIQESGVWLLLSDYWNHDGKHMGPILNGKDLPGIEVVMDAEAES